MTADRINKAKKIFLIDGIGAGISAFLIGVVFPRFDSFLGIPIPYLYILAIPPILFLLFDIWAHKTTLICTSTNLKIIAAANISYCLLSLGVGLYHLDLITIWGWIYISFEILIVISLVI